MTSENKIIDTQIITAADYCRNHPKRPEKKISRDGFCELVEKIFEEVSRVVLIDGEAQSGKTEIIAHFMERNPSNCIGIFLNSDDSYFYSPEYLKLAIVEQISWIVDRRALALDSVDDGLYQRYLHKLQRVAKQSGGVYFLIDGLAEPESLNYRLQTEILSVFPLGQREFKYAITGSNALISGLKLEKYKPKPASIIPVGKDEVGAYFSDFPEVDAKDVADIRSFCRGNVGLLSRFRALLDSGNSVDKIFENKEGSLTALLELEWEREPSLEYGHRILAAIVFSNRSLTAAGVSRLIEVTENEILAYVAQSRFVELDAATGVIGTRSSSDRGFLREKLKEFERYIQENITKILIADPEGVDAVRYLPGQLMSIGRYDDLIRRLDNGHFVKLLETEKSLGALKRHSMIGLAASSKINDEMALFRFGIGGSAISGISLSNGSRAKIEALIELDGADAAIEQASFAPTREERLKLLAATARALKKNKKAVGSGLVEEIKSLASDVDTDAMGPMAVNIACDMLFVDFQMAVNLFNKTKKHLERKSEVPDEPKIDQDGKSKSDSELSQIELSPRPLDQHSRRFSRAIADFVSEIPADRILVGIDDLEPQNALLMLIHWIKGKRKDPDAWKIADKAMDVALKDLGRAPRLKDFRSIAVVLPYISDIYIAEKLAKRVEIQLGNQLALGTTEESIRLEILLERVRHKISPQDAELRLIDIFSKIEQIKDKSVRTACLAWLLYSLQQFSDPNGLDSRTTLISETTKSLLEVIESLLDSTADHFQAARGAIYALARVDVNLAFSLIGKLNTSARRDSAYKVLSEEMVAAGIYEVSSRNLIKCLHLIESEYDRSSAIIKCLSLIANQFERTGQMRCDPALLSVWRSLRIANHKFIALCSCYRILLKIGCNEDQKTEIQRQLNVTWGQVLVDWAKLDLAYLLVHDVAHVDKEFATVWLERALTAGKSPHCASEELSQVLLLVTNLVVRIYAAIASDSSMLDDPELQRVAALVDAIPSPNKKMMTWSDLGLRLYFSGKLSFAKKIASNYIETVLHQDFEGNEYIRDSLIVISAPLLYLVAPQMCAFFLEKVNDQTLVDEARRSACDIILRRVPPSDPYKDPEGTEFDLSLETTRAILDLLRSMRRDGDIYVVISNLANSLVARRNETKMRRAYVGDCLNTMIDIVEEKLPQDHSIKHDGYKIAALAQIYKSRVTLDGPGAVPNVQWHKVFDDAKSIANVADRVVVCALVVACAKGRSSALFPNWLEVIRSDLLNIPAHYDRIDRYQWVSEILELSHKSAAIVLLREGLSLMNAPDAEIGVQEKYKKMLDLAFNIDPGLVDKIIDIADADKAKTASREYYSHRKELKEIQRTLAENPGASDLGKLTSDELSSICRKNMASLAANRIPARSFNEFRGFLDRASSMPMGMAYPVWSFVIENVIRKATQGGRSGIALRDMYVSVCGAGELILGLMGQEKSIYLSQVDELSRVLKPGEREVAIRLIEDWVKKTGGDHIYWSDPYFGPDDVEFLFRISSAAPLAKISIITSRQHIRSKLKNDVDLEEAFLSSWNSSYDVDFPAVTLIVIGAGSDGGHPIHDRWMVSEFGGLRLGTSAQSLGGVRFSEISAMDQTIAAEKLSIISSIVNGSLRVLNNQRLQVASYYLGA